MTPEIVLSLAALGGATMVIIRLSGSPRPPTWLAIGHGLIAVVGLGLLGNVAMQSGIQPMEQIALGGFILAAIGGAVIFSLFHLRNQPLPIPLVLGHGLIAIISLTLLLVY